eukprot:SAG31_NODE_314_length_17854_cov_3.932075_14_plen_101_part_00
MRVAGIALHNQNTAVAVAAWLGARSGAFDSPAADHDTSGALQRPVQLISDATGAAAIQSSSGCAVERGAGIVDVVKLLGPGRPAGPCAGQCNLVIMLVHY